MRAPPLLLKAQSAWPLCWLAAGDRHGMKCPGDFIRSWSRTECCLLEFSWCQSPIKLQTHYNMLATHHGLYYNSGGVSFYYCHCWNYDSWMWWKATLTVLPRLNNDRGSFLVSFMVTGITILHHWLYNPKKSKPTMEMTMFPIQHMYQDSYIKSKVTLATLRSFLYLCSRM